MKIVALSLWGSDPKYSVGANENLRLGRVAYAEWEYEFHVAGDLPAPAARSLIRHDGNPDREGLYWRMAPAIYSDADAVIIRDADSRPSARELACVEEWLESGRAVHTIRDHRCHTAPIMGGLWGCRPQRLRELLPGLQDSYEARLTFVRTADASNGRPKHGRMRFSDQDWLAAELFTKLPRGEFLAHDNRKLSGPDDRPVRVPPKSPMDFCGQVYSAEGVPFWKP